MTGCIVSGPEWGCKPKPAEFSGFGKLPLAGTCKRVSGDTSRGGTGGVTKFEAKEALYCR